MAKTIILLLFLCSQLIAQQPATDDPSPKALFDEVASYSTKRRTELMSSGKRYDNSMRDSIEGERKDLAKKYARILSLRPDLRGTDVYLLGRLYAIVEDDAKTLEQMKRFLSQYPSEEKSEEIRSALGYVIVLTSKAKDMKAAEEAYVRWLPYQSAPDQRPIFQDHLASGYFKSGDYESAVRHAQSAFDLLKTLTAKTSQEKRDREQVYMNLLEVLALGYKKSKNTEQALSVLAEARVRSFTLPSASLYRKVMDFVNGGGFSEKKLMQRIESLPQGEPAPDITVAEWLGQDPTPLSGLRGKVVLLDFWATWCGPCISTFPRLRDWHKKYAGKDFALIGVTQYYGQQSGKRMSPLEEFDFLRDFREKYKLPYGFAIIPPTEASMKFGINAYPTTILLDRNGVVRYIGIGSGAEESENLEDMIKKLMKEQPNLASTPR